MARHRPKHKKNALGVPFLLDERLSVPVVLCVVVLLIPFFELGMVNACYPDMRNIYNCPKRWNSQAFSLQ